MRPLFKVLLVLACVGPPLAGVVASGPGEPDAHRPAVRRTPSVAVADWVWVGMPIEASFVRLEMSPASGAAAGEIVRPIAHVADFRTSQWTYWNLTSNVTSSDTLLNGWRTTFTPADGAYLVRFRAATNVSFTPVEPEEKEEPHQSPVAGSWTSYIVVVESQRIIAVFSPAAGPGQVAVTPTRGPTRRVEALAAGVEVVDGPAWTTWAAWALVLMAIGLLGPGRALVFVMFTRFARDDVLVHPRRATLFECIRSDPGVPFGRLCERAGVRGGSAQHHLGLLEQHGLVRRVRDGRTTRYWPTGPRFAVRPISGTAGARILDALGAEPGLTAGAVAKRLGVKIQSAWEQLRRLRAQGLARAERRGRFVAWRAA